MKKEGRFLQEGKDTQGMFYYHVCPPGKRKQEAEDSRLATLTFSVLAVLAHEGRVNV